MLYMLVLYFKKLFPDQYFRAALWGLALLLMLTAAICSDGDSRTNFVLQHMKVINIIAIYKKNSNIDK